MTTENMPASATTSVTDDPLAGVIEKTRAAVAKEKAKRERQAEKIQTQALRAELAAVALLQQANKHLRSALVESGAFSMLLMSAHLNARYIFYDPGKLKLVEIGKLFGVEIPAERKGMWLCLTNRSNGYGLEFFEEDTAQQILSACQTVRLGFLPPPLQEVLAKCAESKTTLAWTLTWCLLNPGTCPSIMEAYEKAAPKPKVGDRFQLKPGAPDFYVNDHAINGVYISKTLDRIVTWSGEPVSGVLSRDQPLSISLLCAENVAEVYVKARRVTGLKGVEDATIPVELLYRYFDKII